MSKYEDPAHAIEEKVVKSNGDISIKRYSKGKLLGKGGFAKVYEVINTETKQASAIKIMEKAALSKARARQKFLSEIKIHKALHHTNIVKFEGYFEDNECVYLILELCTNQTLNDLMRRRKRLIEIEVHCYLLQVISSLKYLYLLIVKKNNLPHVYLFVKIFFI